METPDYDQLRQTYSQYSDEDLLRLAAESEGLTDPAKDALKHEMQQRGLELQGHSSEPIPAGPELPRKTKSWRFNWIWPVITNEDEAKNAAKSGGVGALFVTVCTGGIAIVAISTGRSYAGIDGYGLVDASLFALIAWRLFRYSFAWAVFGLVMMFAELFWKLSNDPKSAGVITVIITLSLVASVRGTYFLRNKRKVAETKREDAGNGPLSTMSPRPRPENAALLNQFKEELFSLESKKLSGVLAPDEYDEAMANLETGMKRAQEPTISDSNPLASPEPPKGHIPLLSKRDNLGIAFRIAIVLVWAALLTYIRVHEFYAGAAGFYLGTLLLPLFIAYAIAGAKRRRNWVKFSYWFLGLGIILPSLSPPKSLLDLSHSDMMRELIGSKPLEDNLPEDQREMAGLTKAFLADMKAFTKAHDEQVDALEPDLDQLYTSESFSNKDAIQRSLNAIDKPQSLDRETSEMLERMPTSVKTRLDQTNLSDAQKTSFFRSFLASFNNPDFVSARKRMLEVESDWADSARDLYAFSLQHASQIVVNKDAIGISSDGIREKFNEKLTRSEGLYKEYLAAAKNVDDVRAAGLKRAGLTEAELGDK